MAKINRYDVYITFVSPDLRDVSGSEKDTEVEYETYKKEDLIEGVIAENEDDAKKIALEYSYKNTKWNYGYSVYSYDVYLMDKNLGKYHKEAFDTLEKYSAQLRDTDEYREAYRKAVELNNTNQ